MLAKAVFYQECYIPAFFSDRNPPQASDHNKQEKIAAVGQLGSKDLSVCTETWIVLERYEEQQNKNTRKEILGLIYHTSNSVNWVGKDLPLSSSPQPETRSAPEKGGRILFPASKDE